MDETKMCQDKYDEIVREEKGMTRDELREQIAEQLRIDCSFWGQPTPTYETMAKSILTIIDKEGWKSPEEVREIWWKGYDTRKESEGEPVTYTAEDQGIW